ncbi:MAG: T9SS type A sorting domain-containing protein [Candidatus Marinimicrobia bacterium]|nr:T9SS type A sorting domain-containing protein [Candidatus Neomarinimicrobiota bacterium]
MKTTLKTTIITLFITRIVFGTTINIPDDYPYIQVGLYNANSGDTVLVQPGTYYENISWPQINGIRLISAGDTSNTIVDGSTTNGSVLSMLPTTSTIIDATTLIKGFKFTNGVPEQQGGGIRLYNASPTINDVLLKGNSAPLYGGGLHAAAGSNPILENVTIIENSAYSGGGIYAEDSSPILINVTIIDNSADFGGGITLDESSTILTNVMIINNQANEWGGGIYCSYSSSPVLTDVIISGNSSSHGGGIFFSYYSSISTISNVIIKNNNVSDDGGGIFCDENSSPVFTNMSVYGNSAYTGGGFYIDRSNPTLTNVVITSNSASYAGGIYIYGFGSSLDISYSKITNNNANVYGGGMEINGANANLTNVTISNNMANYGGGGIYLSHPNTNVNMENSIMYYDSPDEIYISNGEFGAVYSDIQSGYDGNGNIDEDPMFCYPDTGNYYLDENSPCLGAGEYGVNIGAYGVGCYSSLGTHTSNLIPKNIVLHQNYPNPFNPTTTLRYDLPEDAKVSIMIFDLMGREVKTLVNSQQNAGFKSIIWDATNNIGEPVSAGMYLYNIQAGSYSKTMKMVLLK